MCITHIPTLIACVRQEIWHYAGVTPHRFHEPDKSPGNNHLTPTAFCRLKGVLNYIVSLLPRLHTCKLYRNLTCIVDQSVLSQAHTLNLLQMNANMGVVV